MVGHEIEYRLVTNSGESTVLGRYSSEGIFSTLITHKDRYKDVYLRKLFNGYPSENWRVEGFYISSHFKNKYPIYTFELIQHNPGFKEEYLSETLKKLKAKSPKGLIQRGTLVEVDFGFIPISANSSGGLSGDVICKDVPLEGEMHKRRLAVAVRVDVNSIQVLPVTSKEVTPADKSAFQLTKNTLNRLHFYGGSGKDSWVLCGRPQSVSFGRVLPPVGSGSGSDFKKRNTNYRIELTKHEQYLLQECLMSVIGVANEVEEYKVAISALKERVSALEGALFSLDKDLGGGIVQDYLQKS